MDEKLIPVERIEKAILVLRGQKVMLDRDLAELYGVTTARLNEQVKRNRNRFPDDFLFRLTAQEFKNFMSQSATSSSGWGGRCIRVPVGGLGERQRPVNPPKTVSHSTVFWRAHRSLTLAARRVVLAFLTYRMHSTIIAQANQRRYNHNVCLVFSERSPCRSIGFRASCLSMQLRLRLRLAA
jgi:hypothetical protein